MIILNYRKYRKEENEEDNHCKFCGRNCNYNLAYKYKAVFSKLIFRT